MLEKLYPKEMFGEKIAKPLKEDNDWMNLWKNFCKDNKLKVKLPYLKPKNSDEESENAYKMLMHIIRIANKGWIPNWDDENEYKYVAVFNMTSSGFGFSRSTCDDWAASSHCGSRLCFQSSEVAEEIAKAFLPIFEKYHVM